MVMKPFSKWQPSAILNFRKLLIWSLDLCENVIVLLPTKFHVNQTINRGDHTRTVVRECCKGDDASQWENGKFDPLPRPNPLNDGHKKLHT